MAHAGSCHPGASPGLTPDDFGCWLRGLRSRHRVAVDTSGAALRAALEAGAHLVKPNEHELEGLGMTAPEVFGRFGTGVLHSQGALGLEYAGPEGRFGQPAFGVAAINPVGAGDAALAGFLFGLEHGQGVPGALRFAAACGAAACLEANAGVVSPERIQALLETREVSHA